MKMILLDYDDRVFKGKLNIVMAVEDSDVDFVSEELAYRCNEGRGGRGCPVKGCLCPLSTTGGLKCFELDRDITAKDWKKAFKRKVKKGE